MRLGGAAWAGMFYAMLISAFLGWLLWGWVNAVRRVARSAPLMYLMPPEACLVAWAATGESSTPASRWPARPWRSLQARAATRWARAWWHRWIEPGATPFFSGRGLLQNAMLGR